MRSIPGKYLLILEVALWVYLVLIVKLFLPFRHIVKLLRLKEYEANAKIDFAHPATQLPPGHPRMLSYLEKMGRIASKDKPCLTTALAGLLMFKIRGIKTVLVLGVAVKPDSNLTAHAWLTDLDNKLLLGGKAMPDYQAIALFV